MKILHTSDWHIGKQLHKEELAEDLGFFFDFIVDLIKERQVELLLVSGDVFDQAYPSQKSLRQYYDFLKKMIPTDCKIIITGGNHDSASVLNAPKDLLEHLDIHIVGGAPEDLGDLFIPFHEEGLVVAAVPFLKERDIRKAAEGETYDDRIEQIKSGLKSYYQRVNAYYKEHFSNLSLITMGHLYAEGGYVSDSMRDVQIGNQAAVGLEVFGDSPVYVALGHIHKPYCIGGKSNAYYSGSPIALSFSEKEDRKQVNLLDVSEGTYELEEVNLPVYRELVELSGSFEEVKNAVESFSCNTPLKSLLSLRVREPQERGLIRKELEDLVLGINSSKEHFKIIKYELKFDNQASLQVDMDTEIEDLKPINVFEKRLALEDLNEEEAAPLKQAFLSLIEELKI